MNRMQNNALLLVGVVILLLLLLFMFQRKIWKKTLSGGFDLVSMPLSGSRMGTNLVQEGFDDISSTNIHDVKLSLPIDQKINQSYNIIQESLPIGQPDNSIQMVKPVQPVTKDQQTQQIQALITRSGVKVGPPSPDCVSPNKKVLNAIDGVHKQIHNMINNVDPAYFNSPIVNILPQGVMDKTLTEIIPPDYLNKPLSQLLPPDYLNRQIKTFISPDITIAHVANQVQPHPDLMISN